MERSNTPQVVWITGATSGIGKELALQYAEKGYSVVISGRRTELLNALQKDIQQNGGDAFTVVCDVTNSRSLEEGVASIIAHFGHLDIAIANAGCAVVGLVENLTEHDWNRQLSINVTGLAMTAKYALPELKKTNGRLVLMGSISAILPGPMIAAYGASKAAVHIIGESLQIELQGSGVSCTTIHPGFIDSNITRIDNTGHFHPDRRDPRPANLMWPTDKAVRAMIRAIARRRKVYVFTGHGKVLWFIGRFFPGIARRMMAKQIKEISKDM